jgi:Conjugal transfer protein
MNRIAVCIISYSLSAGLLFGATPTSIPDGKASQVQRVVTALEHLTVLEYEEAVDQAAAGSSAFQIERQDNKVFIKPLKAGATTNLFIWTKSHQSFSYELSVGDVMNMNSELHIVNSKSESTSAIRETSSQMEKVADMVITRTLLGCKPIDHSSVRSQKGSVAVRIQQVFRSQTSLYVQYSIENRTARSYRIANPNLYEIRPARPDPRLTFLRGKQLDEKTIREFDRTRQIPLTIAHLESDEEIAPGQTKQGIVSIRASEDSTAPVVLRLAFDNLVTATAVF